MGNFLSKYTGQQIETMLEQNMANPPYIGENGNWYVYNKEEGDYIDSGISATGPEGAKGDNGEQGPPGPAGPKGDDGRGLNILGIYPTLLDLQTAHAIGNIGDAYAVGSETDNVIYIWDADLLQWVNLGALQGPQGPAGADGKTAYQSAVDGGYTGTEAEFNTILATAQSQIGALSSLNTTDKTSVVNATNEVNTKVGSLATLTTTEKTNAVGAINEVNALLNTHKNKTISSCIYASRDLSLTGDQTITIPFLPKSIIVFANVGNAAYKYSDGIWSENITAGYCRYNMGNITANAYNGSLETIAQIVDSADNYTIATVKSVSTTELVLTWAKAGTGATGTCDLFIQLGTH